MIAIDEAVPMPSEARKHRIDPSLKKIMDRYSEAYKRVYGVRPKIEYTNPWIKVVGVTQRVDRQRLLEMTKQLEYRAG